MVEVMGGLRGVVAAIVVGLGLVLAVEGAMGAEVARGVVTGVGE